MMKRIMKRAAQLGRHGPGGLLQLVGRMYFAPIGYRASQPVFEAQRRALRKKLRSSHLDRRMEALKPRIPSAPPPSVLRTAQLSPGLEQKLAPKRNGSEIVLGEYDQDGALFPQVEGLWTMPVVSKEAFLPRKRFQLFLVDRDGFLGVRKEFGSDSGGFVTELETALDLHERGCSVPAVLAVDWDRRTITFEYIPGAVLRESLAEAGATVRDRGNLASPEQRIASARKVLAKVLSEEDVRAIADELLRIHAAGYALQDIKYGNILLRGETRQPVFVDFERALPLRGLSRNLSIYVRDIDREKFNRHFGTELLTARRLRRPRVMPGEQAGDATAAPGSFSGVYAPAYIGAGIGWGALWNTDVGLGRWNFIMADNLPIPIGGSVLDLGANNGFNALQMLKAGAKSVVAVELDSTAIQQGLFLKQVYEWADNRSYDLRYVQGSHGDLQSLKLGNFDVVTAFCTLYYLGAEEMKRSIGFIRSMTDTLVLQCNIDRLINRSDPETYTKASIEFSVSALRENDFPSVEVIAPKGYSRPLVIGRAA